MRRISSLALISFLLMILSCNRSPRENSFLHVSGQAIVDGKGDTVILRGIGLGGWMLQEGYMLRVEKIGSQQHKIRAEIEKLIGPTKTQEFYDAWLSHHTTRKDIEFLKAAGFNSIRLPMHYNLFTHADPQDTTWLEKGFALTDELLKWCSDNRMYLILDLHAAPGGQGSDLAISDRDDSKPSLWQSEANQQKTIALWRKLAARYANEPWIGGFDMINEPNWGFESSDDGHGCAEQTNEPLKMLLTSITRAIREVDKNHIVIVEGNCWGNNYAGMFPLWDPNTVVSFHKYWNNNDTASIRRFLDIREKQHVPVWLGESGENSNVWFRDCIRLMEENGIGWCWWPLKKLGFNNPLQVKQPEGYQRILDFWKGEGPQPTAAEAYESLMQLAANTQFENCIQHKDVIDAMFRQVRSDEALPFGDHAVGEGLTLEAVNYDLGRAGIAYADNDVADYHISSGGDWHSWNHGRVYRNDGVDISESPLGGYYVSMDKDEWLQYSFDIGERHEYVMTFQVGSRKGGSLLVEGDSLHLPIDVPGGRENEWRIVSLKAVLSPGLHRLRVRDEKGEVNFKTLDIKRNRPVI